MSQIAKKTKRGSLIILVQGNVTTEKLIKDNTIIGRASEIKEVDIRLNSPLVSRIHGQIFKNGDRYYYADNNSTNGTYVDGRLYKGRSEVAPLDEGSIIEIKSKNDAGVLIIFSMFDYSRQKWRSVFLEDGVTNQLLIGRSVTEPNIRIPTVQISRQHGVFMKNNGRWFYQDLDSKNGTFINRTAVRNVVPLNEKDVIQIINIKIIYTRGMLIYNLPNAGCELRIDNISKLVKCPKSDPSYKNGNGKKCILDRVTVTIEPSEFVAVLGGSGAGKTTFLNCINGYEEATSGAVYMDGINLYEHKDILKKQIGYVPQEDLLRNGISVRKTLEYIAKMRLPADVDREEREKRIDQTFEMLGLDEKCQASDVKKVSGGQRKRVSIASELVSDPPILFLDEPTSGLDPETETNLIASLRQLAHTHEKTVIVITHTLKNIDMFDKILFFAPGGKLCFAGSPDEAYELFQVQDMTEVYRLVREYTAEFEQNYRESL